jgi:hypothetical protein
VRAVAVGGVKEGDAGGDGVVDERDHVRLGLASVWMLGVSSELLIRL